MKTSQYLTIATLCSSFANCFPQGFNPSRRSNAVLASTPEDPEYYVVVKARTITIGDTTTTIKGFTIGNPGETGPYTTFSAADDRLPDPTDAPIATSVQSRKAHKTTSTSKPAPTNPWNAACPVPSTFTINNFVFVSGKGGDVSFTVTYGNTTYSCPQEGQEAFGLGYYDLNCGDNRQVHAQTDGSSWILINERYTCYDVPHPNNNYATVASWTNFTRFADQLFCDTDDANVQTCLQLDPNIEIPVLHYDTTGSITSK